MLSRGLDVAKGLFYGARAVRMNGSPRASRSQGASCSGDPAGSLLELGRSHATHFRDLLLVDMQLARLNMGKVDLAPFALAATVAVVLAVHHVSEVLELIGLARNAELFVDAARRGGGRDVFRERMAGAAIGERPRLARAP